MFVYYIFLFGLFYHHVMSTQEVVLCIYYFLLPKFSIVIIFFYFRYTKKKNYLLWDELNFKYEKFFKMEFYFFVCELFIDVLLL